MRIEILEEDDDSSLMFEDEYAEYTIEVNPGSKTYQSKMSRKDDVYYRTQKFEYRICTMPVRVEIRLLERLDEPPPDKYAVKDGVVLESGILVRSRDFLASMTNRFIAEALSELCVGFRPQSEGILGLLIRQEGARWTIASFCSGSMSWLRS